MEVDSAPVHGDNHQMKSKEIASSDTQHKSIHNWEPAGACWLPVGSATLVSFGIFHGLPKLCPRHRVINGKRAERDRKRDGIANGMSSPRVTPNRNRNKPKCCTAHSALTRYTMVCGASQRKERKIVINAVPF